MSSPMQAHFIELVQTTNQTAASPFPTYSSKQAKIEKISVNQQSSRLNHFRGVSPKYQNPTPQRSVVPFLIFLLHRRSRMTTVEGPAVWFASQTLDIIKHTIAPYVELPSVTKKTKGKVFDAIQSLPPTQQNAIRAAAARLPRHIKRRAPTAASSSPSKRQKVGDSSDNSPTDMDVDRAPSGNDDPTIWFGDMTLAKMVGFVYEHAPLRPVDKRTRASLFSAVSKMSEEMRTKIRSSLTARVQKSNPVRRLSTPDVEDVEMREESQNGWCGDYDSEDEECFLQSADEGVVHACIAKFVLPSYILL
ncbi:hypothetical protein R3P38DRAFT_2771513 [Favolaschia claudopus]|uniref:Uncharacterized protein n=1 Tax=Favolaschia claudopus TaxID=2862362 RepID=A0AAW0CBE5_9AGAR